VAAAQVASLELLLLRSHDELHFGKNRPISCTTSFRTCRNSTAFGAGPYRDNSDSEWRPHNGHRRLLSRTRTQCHSRVSVLDRLRNWKREQRRRRPATRQ
jgi:hypothetical protein